MATIKFLLQGKGSSSNIYVRLSAGRGCTPKRKSGSIIDSRNWNSKEAMPFGRDEQLKRLRSKLSKLKIFIEDAYNHAAGSGTDFSGEWLQNQIDIFNKKKIVIEGDILTNRIDAFIDSAPYKRNQKNELGLSAGRVSNLKLFRTTIVRYQDEILKGKNILIKDINLKFVEQYKKWLFDQNYAVSYVGKNISNLITICNDGRKNEIEVSTQFESIQTVSEKRNPEEIIYLSEEEQDKVKSAPIIRPALLNARKWLLFGCQIGQRAGDLLSITEKDFKDIGGMRIVELKQQKSGKLVAVPLLPDAMEIIESGLPYKISLVKFNEYLKEICQAAELDKPTIGRIKQKGKRGATIKGIFPKYQLISSHVCRRSFATNFYGRIPTPVLMNITAHGTEQMFLKYIGKTTYDNAYQMLDYFGKLQPKTRPATLEVIRETANNI